MISQSSILRPHSCTDVAKSVPHGRQQTLAKISAICVLYVLALKITYRVLFQ